jgi:hypothetical protein
MAAMETANTFSSATGGVRRLLRLEGAALMCVALLLFGHFGGSWLRFAALFLAPDLAFAFYLFGPRIGAIAYNTTHTTLGPLALGLFAVLSASPLARALAMIWLAHVGFDRALGYGLKYTSAFRDTHLGRIGRSSEET